MYTKEAIEQVNEFLGTAKAYLNAKGGLINSPFVETVNRVVTGMMST